MLHTLDLFMLIIHISAGCLSLVTGLAAMLAPKRRGRHTSSGRLYYWLVTLVCFSAVVMSVINWSVSSYLFYVAVFSYLFALLGYMAYKQKWHNWRVSHIAGMGGSYIAMVTGFIVVNQSHVHYLDKLPSLVFWLLPTIIGTPLIIRTGNRYDLRKAKKRLETNRNADTNFQKK